MSITNGTGSDLTDPAKQTRPCTYCPAWEFMADPATREGERQIRADAALRFQRTFDMWAKQLERANEEIARLNRENARLRAKAS